MKKKKPTMNYRMQDAELLQSIMDLREKMEDLHIAIEDIITYREF